MSRSCGDRIAAVGPAGTLDPAGAEVYDATGLLVTPGLIDLHTHIYDGATGLGVPADLAGVRQGVTTVVDAEAAAATTGRTSPPRSSPRPPPAC